MTFLRYPMAYGFVLIGYGPFHHLAVIPIYQRLRREGSNLSLGGHLHLPNASLAVFLVIVIVLGTFPVAPVTLDFQSTLENSGVDIDPALLCVKSTHQNGTHVHCHLSESRGVDRVVVQSGGEPVLTDREPPFEFTVAVAEMDGNSGMQRFSVDLLDEDGSLIRRYTRTLSMIDVG